MYECAEGVVELVAERQIVVFVGARLVLHASVGDCWLGYTHVCCREDVAVRTRERDARGRAARCAENAGQRRADLAAGSVGVAARLRMTEGRGRSAASTCGADREQEDNAHKGTINTHCV